MDLTSVCSCLMLALNIFFLCTGLLFIAVGSIFVFNFEVFLESAFNDAKEEATTYGYVITGEADELSDFPLLHEFGVACLVLGSALFLVAVFGLMGSCCTRSCKLLLLVYSTAMVLLSIGQITVFSLFLQRDSSLHKVMKDEVKDMITSEYDERNGNTFTAAIIIIQREANCCGIDGVEDFGSKQHNACDVEDEQKGCYDKLQDEIKDIELYIALAISFHQAFQLVTAVSSLIIFRNYKPVGQGANWLDLLKNV